jgi:hypothetical protein
VVHGSIGSVPGSGTGGSASGTSVGTMIGDTGLGALGVVFGGAGRAGDVGAGRVGGKTITVVEFGLAGSSLGSIAVAASALPTSAAWKANDRTAALRVR